MNKLKRILRNHHNLDGPNSTMLWYPSSGDDVRPLFIDEFNSFIDLRISVCILNDTDPSLFRSFVKSGNTKFQFKPEKTEWLTDAVGNSIPITSYTVYKTEDKKTVEKKFLFINASNANVLSLLILNRIRIDIIHSRYCIGTEWHNNLVAFESTTRQLKVKYIITDENYLSFSPYVREKIENCFKVTLNYGYCWMTNEDSCINLHQI